jgi:hypothetical protein
MTVIDFMSWSWMASGKPVPTFPHPAFDHDAFGLAQSKSMTVIDFVSWSGMASGKPVPTFPHPALDSAGGRCNSRGE